MVEVGSRIGWKIDSLFSFVIDLEQGCDLVTRLRQEVLFAFLLEIKEGVFEDVEGQFEISAFATSQAPLLEELESIL